MECLPDCLRHFSTKIFSGLTAIIFREITLTLELVKASVVEIFPEDSTILSTNSLSIMPPRDSIICLLASLIASARASASAGNLCETPI